MIDLDLPTEQEQLQQVIQRLASTARLSGLDVAGGMLEALQDALAQPPRRGPPGR